MVSFNTAKVQKSIRMQWKVIEIFLNLLISLWKSLKIVQTITDSTPYPI